MHLDDLSTEKHSVIIVSTEDDTLAYGKVSYSQILLLELNGFILKENENHWKILGETPAWLQ